MKNRSKSLLLATLVLALAGSCASSSPQESGNAPMVYLEQVGRVMEMGVKADSGVPVVYKLTIENPFDHEVRLRYVEVGSVGDGGGYSMKRVRHQMDQSIAANSKYEFSFRAWVKVLTESEMRAVDHPVLLQGTARFDSPVGKMARNFSTSANGSHKTDRDKPPEKPKG